MAGAGAGTRAGIGMGSGIYSKFVWHFNGPIISSFRCANVCLLLRMLFTFLMSFSPTAAAAAVYIVIWLFVYLAFNVLLFCV